MQQKTSGISDILQMSLNIPLVAAAPSTDADGQASLSAALRMMNHLHRSRERNFTVMGDQYETSTRGSRKGGLGKKIKCLKGGCAAQLLLFYACS